jgi:hypothetical protein
MELMYWLSPNLEQQIREGNDDRRHALFADQPV